MAHILLAVLIAVLPAASVTAQTTPETPPETTVDASRGGITIASGVNSLTVGARAQFRWTVEDRERFDADAAGEGENRDDDVLSQFDVPRLRVSLSGGVFRPWLRYAFQFDFSRTSGEGASKIKDAVLEIRPPGRGFNLQVGQFKVPFGLQQLTSSGRQQFVDRAITDSKFTPARDMGVSFGGTVAARKIGYAAGVFNGSGESRPQNNQSHLWAARVWLDPLGAYALSEGASDAGENLVLHVGGAVRGGEAARGRTTRGIVEKPDDQLAYTVEFGLKMPRFYSTAEYFWMTDEQENPVAAAEVDSRGYHAQAGLMILPRTTEIGIRYAEVVGDTDVDDAELREILGVFGYYWARHNLKVQADVGQIRYGANYATLPSRARQGLPSLGNRLVAGESLADTRLRVQLQLAF